MPARLGLFETPNKARRRYQRLWQLTRLAPALWPLHALRRPCRARRCQLLVVNNHHDCGDGNIAEENVVTTPFKPGFIILIKR